MKTIAILLLAMSPAAWWQSVWRETNSHASAQRGATQYSTKRYDESAKSFADSDHLSPSPKTAFNLGTAQVAAGKMTEGSATLGRAIKDPSLRADGLFNRGNSALQSKAYEYAIRDYVDTLKIRPNDSGAKRNLEIAQQQLQAQRRSAAGRQGQQQPSPSNQQQSQKAPSAGPKEDQQQGDAEALLRSVQQQEQEELQRMKKAKRDNVRVGW